MLFKQPKTMTIKNFNKKQYEEQNGIIKFRNTLNRIQYLQKQIRRDSLPSEDYLKVREQQIKELLQQMEDFVV